MKKKLPDNKKGRMKETESNEPVIKALNKVLSNIRKEDDNGEMRKQEGASKNVKKHST